jgi:hypothetical protein
MSSDCFYVRVKSVNGREVIFDVLTSTAGGTNDLCASRSFALLLLSDALRRSVDNLPGGWDDPQRQQEVERRYEAHDVAPLIKELENAGDYYVNESWMQKNVERFVKKCELVERRNNLGDEELSRREEEIANACGGALYTNQYHVWQPLRWQRCHNYTLRVTLADPKWGAHLEPGIEFGTTAYDVWYERPQA